MELRAGAQRTMSSLHMLPKLHVPAPSTFPVPKKESKKGKDDHVERSALNEVAPSNCDAAGVHAAVSERDGVGGRAGALG